MILGYNYKNNADDPVRNIELSTVRFLNYLIEFSIFFYLINAQYNP